MIKNFFYYKNDEVGYSEIETLQTTKELHSGIYKLFIGLDDRGIEITKIKSMKDVENVNIIEFPQTERLNILFSKFLDKKIK